jgi:hypothetical protein
MLKISFLPVSASMYSRLEARLVPESPPNDEALVLLSARYMITFRMGTFLFSAVAGLDSGSGSGPIVKILPRQYFISIIN